MTTKEEPMGRRRVSAKARRRLSQARVRNRKFMNQRAEHARLVHKASLRGESLPASHDPVGDFLGQEEIVMGPDLPPRTSSLRDLPAVMRINPKNG